MAARQSKFTQCLRLKEVIDGIQNEVDSVANDLCLNGDDSWSENADDDIDEEVIFPVITNDSE